MVKDKLNKRQWDMLDTIKKTSEKFPGGLCSGSLSRGELNTINALVRRDLIKIGAFDVCWDCNCDRECERMDKQYPAYIINMDMVKKMKTYSVDYEVLF